MDREEFETYLNANSRVVAIFRSQALAYQHSVRHQSDGVKLSWQVLSIKWSVNLLTTCMIDSKLMLKRIGFSPMKAGLFSLRLIRF